MLLSLFDCYVKTVIRSTYYDLNACIIIEMIESVRHYVEYMMMEHAVSTADQLKS
jgi:hypothetical protein